MYCTRVVECGYSQVPRVHFSKKYLLVVNDIACNILLLMVIQFRFLAKIVNVKTGFLNEDLQEEINMEFIQGMKNIGKDDCTVLDKCIYGLVVRQHHRKAVKIFKSGVQQRQH